MRVTYKQIIDAVNLRGGFYDMELVGAEAKMVRDAVNQQIDSHLEACFMPHRGDSYEVDGGRLKCNVSAESLPVLLRRLWDAHQATDIVVTGCLVEDILTSLCIPIEWSWQIAQ